MLSFNVQDIDYMMNPSGLFPAVACNTGRDENDTYISVGHAAHKTEQAMNGE